MFGMHFSQSKNARLLNFFTLSPNVWAIFITETFQISGNIVYKSVPKCPFTLAAFDVLAAADSCVSADGKEILYLLVDAVQCGKCRRLCLV